MFCIIYFLCFRFPFHIPFSWAPSFLLLLLLQLDPQLILLLPSSTPFFPSSSSSSYSSSYKHIHNFFFFFFFPHLLHIFLSSSSSSFSSYFFFFNYMQNFFFFLFHLLHFFFPSSSSSSFFSTESTVYRDPKLQAADHIALYNEIQSIKQGKNAIVIGDFNCANFDWRLLIGDQECSILINMVEDSFLTQAITRSGLWSWRKAKWFRPQYKPLQRLCSTQTRQQSYADTRLPKG